MLTVAHALPQILAIAPIVSTAAANTVVDSTQTAITCRSSIGHTNYDATAKD